jgi:hypothetical protein
MKNEPALTAQTKLNHEGSIDSKVLPKLRITYKFDILSKKTLSLPYAFSINGVFTKEFRDAAKKIVCSSGKIEIYALPGERVELFLNSDAHPLYRRNPVYLIIPDDCDILINVIEKRGKHIDTDKLRECGIQIIDNKKTKIYEAALTGDIWMKISHKYTSAEAHSLISSSFSQIIVENVKRIYDDLKQPCISFNVPSQGSSSIQRSISISFTDSENARENIKTGYDFLSEGLTRAHPAGYAAIINAAVATGIDKVRITSTWRPMMGSIAHRAGLGLDVDFIGSTQLNREKLRKSFVKTKNVSEEEITFFKDFEIAKKRHGSANSEVRKARAAVEQNTGNSALLIDAKKRLNEAVKAAEEADIARKNAEALWIAERDKNEPEEVKRFRQALITSPAISQLFDPWVIDSNTSDDKLALSNTQTDDNEKLHAHHLHITVREPKIL